MATHTILVVNTGSTSTKIAVANNDTIVQSEKIYHSSDDLHRCGDIWSQYPSRLIFCKQWAGQHLTECSAVVAIGGLLRPLVGGTYHVNSRMIDDARRNLQGEHASNLGCAIASDIAERFRCPAFVVDPVSVEEFQPLAYYSGHPAIKRKSLSHALNIHAAARWAAKEVNISLERSSFIVAHLGGGISIAPVRSGKIIDVNDAASDGPFSPERTGGLPLQAFISLCCSKEYSEQELRSFVMGKGGLVAYLGTNSAEEVEARIMKGDETAREVYEAMAYQIAKEIGAMAAVLRGDVNAIVLTGGLASSTVLIPWIKERVRFIAPILTCIGDDEMRALASGAFRVLAGEEQAKEY